MSPIVAVPHTSRKLRAILDLPFKILLNRFEMTPVNESMSYTAKHKAIEQLGKVLPRIITAIEETPEDYGPIFFIKIDIKYGSWKMLCQAGSEWNFTYVLPVEEKEEKW